MGARHGLVRGEVATGSHELGDWGGSVVVTVVHGRLLPVGRDLGSVPEATGKGGAHG